MRVMTESNYVAMLPKAESIIWEANVNGVSKKALIPNHGILLDVLRDEIGCLGVKRGCDMGTCGCCAVLIDGKPRLSCMTLAGEVSDSEITTVEGLSNGHQLHPIQSMFAECGGSQCGFCTPGFLVVISSLLEENNNPTDAEIKTAIEGNLCRCTGYQQIVDSVHAAAEIVQRAEAIADSTDAKANPHPGMPELD